MKLKKTSYFLPEIAGSSVSAGGVTGGKATIEMLVHIVVVVVVGILAEYVIVAVRVVRTLNPNFAKMRVGTLAFRFGISNDHFNSWQKFARLEKTQRVRAALLHDGHAIVAQRTLVHVDRCWVGIRCTL